MDDNARAEGSHEGTDPESGRAAPALNAAPDWPALLAAAPRPTTEHAVTYFRGPWSSASKPVCVKCADGRFRVLKGKQAGGRMLFNDQVVARLAQTLHAPVPPPAIVVLPLELIAMQGELAHMPAGLCHGSEFLDGHSDREGVGHIAVPGNRERFASLAILYGWAYATDHQQIYPNVPPHVVWSVDHGHFIGNGPNWTAAELAARPPASADQVIVNGATLTALELQSAVVALAAVEAVHIAAAIAAAPDEWDIPMPDRLAFATYMWKRRGELLAAHHIQTPATPVAAAGER